MPIPPLSIMNEQNGTVIHQRKVLKQLSGFNATELFFLFLFPVLLVVLWPFSFMLHPFVAPWTPDMWGLHLESVCCLELVFTHVYLMGPPCLELLELCYYKHLKHMNPSPRPVFHYGIVSCHCIDPGIDSVKSRAPATYSVIPQCQESSCLIAG